MNSFSATRDNREGHSLKHKEGGEGERGLSSSYLAGMPTSTSSYHLPLFVASLHHDLASGLGLLAIQVHACSRHEPHRHTVKMTWFPVFSESRHPAQARMYRILSPHLPKYTMARRESGKRQIMISRVSLGRHV